MPDRGVAPENEVGEWWLTVDEGKGWVTVVERLGVGDVVIFLGCLGWGRDGVVEGSGEEVELAKGVGEGWLTLGEGEDMGWL